MIQALSVSVEFSVGLYGWIKRGSYRVVLFLSLSQPGIVQLGYVLMRCFLRSGLSASGF